MYSAKHPEIDKQVYEWIIARRNEGAIINRCDVMCKALQISQQHNVKMKASRGWLAKFLFRNRLSLKLKNYKTNYHIQ